MPETSLRHQLLTALLPRVRRSGELESVEAERERVLRRQAGQDRSLPTRLVPRFASRFVVERDDSAGFPSWVVTPRELADRPDPTPARTIFYVHGGGYTAPIDPFHMRWTTRLARAASARVVLPDYPLAPAHTWRDSHAAMAALAARWATRSAEEGGELVLAGDSAGGGYALAVAQTLRDAGGPQASRMVLHAPWVDLADSTPEETQEATRDDPWLFLSKIQAYATWWAGSPDDLTRPEVSPGLASLADLPPALMFHGTRDTLAPGCRLLVRRAAEAGWSLTSVEEPGLLHVYPLLPVPEADRAFRRVLEFLQG